MVVKSIKKRVTDLISRIKKLAPDDTWMRCKFYEVATHHKEFERRIKKWPVEDRNEVIDLLRTVADRLER